MPPDGGEAGEDEPAKLAPVVDLAEERTERARKWMHFRTEDMSAIDGATATRLLLEYGKLVKYLVGKYQLPMRSLAPADVDDLHATGVVVLFQSWLCYDPDRGMKFASWAALNIRRAFTAMLREAFVGNSKGTTPDAMRPTLLSCEEPVYAAISGGGEVVGDMLEAPPDRVLSDNERWLYEHVHMLPPREQHVLLLSMQEMTFEAIGEHMGITRQRADQMYRKALARLRWIAWDEGLIEGDEPAEGAPADVAPRRRLRLRIRLIAHSARTAEM